MKIQSTILAPSLLLALTGTVFSQGDDCSTPTPIGDGTVSFDTTTNTTSDFDGGGSCGAGATTINQDAFFLWTASAGGTHSFDTFGSSFDTKISVHSGSDCSATCVAYNDDEGGLQSYVTVSGVALGDTFLVQVGGFGDNAGQAMLTIQPGPDTCDTLPDDTFEDNDDCNQAALLGDGLVTQLNLAKVDPDFYTMCVGDGETLLIDAFFSNATADMDLFLWEEGNLECGTGINGVSYLARSISVTDDETIIWTNFTGAEVSVVLEGNIWVNSVGECNTYDLLVTGSSECASGLGVPFCIPVNSGSADDAAELTGTPNPGVGAGVHLEVSNGPPMQFGYVLIGDTISEPGLPIGNGRLCLEFTNGSFVGRYNIDGTNRNSIGQFDANGVMQNFVGTSTIGSGFDVPVELPPGTGPLIMSGQTWHFQVWHRDNFAGASNMNFSNGLTVTMP